jgi:hypothetical protein
MPKDLVSRFEEVRFSYEPGEYVSIIETALSFPVDAELLELMEEVLDMLANCQRPGTLGPARTRHIVAWLEAAAPSDGPSRSSLMMVCWLLLPDPVARDFVNRQAAVAPTEALRATWQSMLDTPRVTLV